METREEDGAKEEIIMGRCRGETVKDQLEITWEKGTLQLVGVPKRCRHPATVRETRSDLQCCLMSG